MGLLVLADKFCSWVSASLVWIPQNYELYDLNCEKRSTLLSNDECWKTLENPPLTESEDKDFQVSFLKLRYMYSAKNISRNRARC